MIRLGEDFKKVQPKGRPTKGDYPMKIVGATTGLSKTSKRNMLSLSHDIASGPCEGFFRENPLKCYFVLDDADSLARFKQFLIDLNQSNPADRKINIDSPELDETAMIGMLIGATLVPSKRDPRFLEIGQLIPLSKVSQ